MHQPVDHEAERLSHLQTRDYPCSTKAVEQRNKGSPQEAREETKETGCYHGRRNQRQLRIGLVSVSAVVVDTGLGRCQARRLTV